MAQVYRHNSPIEQIEQLNKSSKDNENQKSKTWIKLKLVMSCNKNDYHINQRPFSYHFMVLFSSLYSSIKSNINYKKNFPKSTKLSNYTLPIITTIYVTHIQWHHRLLQYVHFRALVQKTSRFTEKALLLHAVDHQVTKPHNLQAVDVWSMCPSVLDLSLVDKQKTN